MPTGDRARVHRCWRPAQRGTTQRESVVAVAERRGHEKATLVLKTYGHLMAGADDRTRRAVDGAWSVEADANSGEIACRREQPSCRPVSMRHVNLSVYWPRRKPCHPAASRRRQTLNRNVARVRPRSSGTCGDGRKTLPDLRLCIVRRLPTLTAQYRLWPSCHGPQTAQKITERRPCRSCPGGEGRPAREEGDRSRPCSARWSAGCRSSGARACPAWLRCLATAYRAPSRQLRPGCSSPPHRSR